LRRTFGRLSLGADAERLAELLIDLEEDEPARLHLVAAFAAGGLDRGHDAAEVL
jgi:hypothetical protein